MLENSQFRRPVGPETLPIGSDSRLVDFRTRLQIVDYPRKHTLRRFASLDRGLSRPGRVDANEADAVRQNCTEIFGKIFLATVETANGDYHWNRAFGIFRQSQVAHNLRTIKRNAHNFERRIHKLC